MNQLLLKFQLPRGVRLFPNAFRELVAKQDLDMPAAFHRNAVGTSNVGLPPISFVGGVSWVGILSQPNQDHLLHQLLGPAATAISRHLNTNVPMNMVTLELGAEKKFSPINYRLREMALKRRYDSTRAKPVDLLIRERLLSGLARIASTHMIDLPSDDFLDVAVTIRKERGLRLQVHNVMTNEYVHLVDADISMNVALSGMWQVGNLTSRGYGRLIQEHPGIPSHKKIIGVEHA